MRVLPSPLYFPLVLIAVFPKALGQGILSVTSPSGTIQGGKCPSSGASRFLGIPYAEPPVGSLRFKAPKPYSAGYNGTFQATTAAASCIQFGPLLFEEAGPSSEDCLTVDIWVPPTASPSSQLPVKAWVFGGAGVAGGISDPLYDGCNLASDSIVVSINYRVGPLGFLSLPSAGIQGNMAVQDVILGLEWIQTNIASFGGDPRKVLVFGQANGAELFSCIQKISTNALNASIPVGTTTGGDNEFYVTRFDFLVDGNTIPAQPADVGTNVPAIFGWTLEEGTLYVLPNFPFPPTVANYSTFLVQNFGAFAQQINQTYPLSKFSSLQFPVYSAMVVILTDYTSICRAYRALSTASKKGIPSFTYVWGKEPSCSWYSAIEDNPEVLQLLGATHTSEIPFVFNNTVNLPGPNGTCSFTDFEKSLATDIVQAYTSMAMIGTPNGISSLNWPAFSNSTQYHSSTNNIVNHQFYSSAPQHAAECLRESRKYIHSIRYRTSFLHSAYNLC
ncbi:alpha/beta-hydrolase [Hyaloscypha variabilis F]|uniref:Alpha/beta-hydrolase n=1 Tax=Hyaloscypha variabilis (strain UAMH 11265 / GT02V1 / F) TaxID=1149755 RepID=A0A2J6QXU0_HYAVF|nr:alpha/beta-hydrolase [Hyaloscypha variabilis F]